MAHSRRSSLLPPSLPPTLRFPGKSTPTMSEIQGLPLDPLPEKPAPKPTSTSTSIPPPPPPPSTLRSWLPLYLSRTDRTIEHLSRILSSPVGSDKLLLTICYSSLLTSTILSSISLARIRSAARQIIEKAIALPPNTTVIIDTSSIKASRLLVTAQRLKALSSLISDFRTFTRLWGILDIWTWGKGVFVTGGQESAVLRRIAKAQVLVNVAYSYYEVGAYLSSKGVLGWDKKRQNRAWALSSRYWMSHIVMDIFKAGYEYRLRTKNMKNDESVEGVSSEWWATWKRKLVTNLAYAPLSLHWSLEEGLVDEFWIGLLGSVVGVTAMRHIWKTTA